MTLPKAKKSYVQLINYPLGRQPLSHWDIVPSTSAQSECQADTIDNKHGALLNGLLFETSGTQVRS